MKPLTEIKDGQKVLVELSVKQFAHTYRLYDNKNELIIRLNEDLKFEGDKYPQTIYDFNEVISYVEKTNNPKEIDKEDFERKITIIDYEGNFTNKHYDDLYNLFKSYNPKSEVIFPQVGEVYEFCNELNGVWVKRVFVGFQTLTDNHYTFIRPVQQPSEEELKAIKLLKSKGYKIEKE